MANATVVVHGGAGAWDKRRVPTGLKGVAMAAREGIRRLAGGDSAIDAVEAAVNAMEDNPAFNAGLGSTITLTGEIEMDASIMEGRFLRAGAVTLVKNIAHPVSLARLVMDKTDHVLLGAWGAEKLADLLGVERRDPRTSWRMNLWRRARREFLQGQLPRYSKMAELLRDEIGLESLGTVGAVARDAVGDTAAATSTGGMLLKFPGRIGDSPLIGSGTYADNKSGAVSVTGTGEAAIRLGLAKAVCDYMSRGTSAQKAAARGVELVNSRMKLSIGLISIDKRGRIGAAQNTPGMCWAYQWTGMRKPVAKANAAKVKVSI